MSEATEISEPVLPAVTMHACKPNEPATGRVVRNEVCTASRKASGFVHHLEIDVGGTPLEGVCVAGQSVGVLAPGEDASGRRHKPRLYSLACGVGGEDGAGRILSTTVKRTIDEHWESGKLFLGVASNYLCDLGVGDEIELTGPAGKRFLLPEDTSAHDYALFSTGTGIAPFRGFVRDLLSRDETSRVTLVSGSPYHTDLLYHDEFVELASKHPERFTYLTAVSRGDNDGHGRMYVGDRVRSNSAHFEELLGSERSLIYICGIAGMELNVMRRVAELLGPDRLGGYLGAEREVLAAPASWEAKGLMRSLKPTRRVMLEVYD
jgi:ferredoxin--NADP+ reductase